VTASVSARDFASFRSAARSLVLAGITPRDVRIRDALGVQASLFDADMELPSVDPSRALKVPRRYFELAELGVLFRKDDRFDLPYRILYRLVHGEPRLLEDELDDDVRNLTLRVQAIGRDEHRMHAFVRFRSMETDEG
jgi:probable DNA metabolism protein